MTTATEFVKITQLAYDEVKKLVEKEEKPGIGLRLSVKGGGCSGLSYDLSFTTEEKGDNITEKKDFKVFIDIKSMIYLLTKAYNAYDKANFNIIFTYF